MSSMNDGQPPAKRPRGRPRKHPAPDPNAPKRPRGRPRKDPGAPSKPASEAVKAAAVKGRISRWGGLHRERCKQIGVDPDAAAELAKIPERVRRRIASDAIRAVVAAYMFAHAMRD